MVSAAPLLIPAFAACLFAAIHQKPQPMRESLIVTATMTGALVLISTELLSAVTALTGGWLSMWWGAMAIGAFLIALPKLRAFAERPPRILDTVRQLDSHDRASAGVLIILSLGTLSSALLYPPTNWDSLTYHLPRTIFWMQNASVAHFPTAEARQLFSSPWSDYMALQLLVMNGGNDFFTGLTQWPAYLLAAAAASLIAMRLGAGRRGQQYAALAAASVPMAVLQASTTQNDLNCALWSLITVYGVLRLLGAKDLSVSTQLVGAALTGVAAGLSFLTKPTAALVLLPFALWFLLHVLVRRRRELLWTLLVTTSCFALISTPWAARNAAVLEGDILAVTAPGNIGLLMESRAPERLASNGLRNAVMLMGTPSPTVNSWARDAVTAVTVDPVPDEPGGRYGEFWIPHQICSHDLAPAPLTLFLLVSAALLTTRRAPQKHGRHYALVSGAGLILTIVGIGWQPWISRLLLPAILVMTPVVGIVSGSPRRPYSPRGERLLQILVVGSVSLSLIVMMCNAANPLIPRGISAWNASRAELRFKMLPELADATRQIVELEAVDTATVVGIRQHQIDFPIYPMLTALKEITAEVHYVSPTVLSDRIPRAKPDPEVIIDVRVTGSPIPTEPGDEPTERLAGPFEAGAWTLTVLGTPE